MALACICAESRDDVWVTGHREVAHHPLVSRHSLRLLGANTVLLDSVGKCRGPGGLTPKGAGQEMNPIPGFGRAVRTGTSGPGLWTALPGSCYGVCG